MPVRSYLGGSVLAERTEGDAPALLCLHGWGRTRRDLAKTAAGHRALLLDLPGFGSSPPPDGVWGAADYARVVAEVAEADGGPYVVIGHSRGGCIAACLGAARPDLVAGIVIVAAPLLRVKPAKGPSLGYRMVRFANRVGVLPDAKLERIRQQRGSADYRAATGVMRQVLVKQVGEDYSEELRALTCPVAFCWGRNDAAVAPEVGERAASLVKNVVGSEIVEDADHDVHLSHPEAVVRAIGSVEKALSCP